MNSIAEAFKRAENKSNKHVNVVKPKPISKARHAAKIIRKKVDNEAWTYTEVARTTNVLVLVPRLSQHMQLVAAHTFVSSTGPVEIKDHYKIGQVVEGGVIVNRHFYVSAEVLGKKIIAEAVIILKERGTQKYVVVDYYHTPEAALKREIKFVPNGQIEIPNSKIGINISERPVR
ncbi:MAG: hypothetical protein WCG01_04365 [bacterium]